MSIKAEIRKVTHTWAQSVLDEHNKRVQDGKFRQRHVNPKLVNRYANDMLAGNWTLNGESIVFDEDGNLMNGQHRLWAVVRSKQTVMMMVITGVPVMGGESGSVKTMDTLDIGRSRNFAMQMRIEGKHNCNQMAAMVRNVAMLAMNSQTLQLSPAQSWAILELIEPHYDAAREIICKDNQIGNARGFIMGPITFLRREKTAEVDLFCEEFNSMANLGKFSPVLQLRRYIERPSTKQGTEYTFKSLGAVCTALQAYCLDEKTEHIKGGSSEAMEWVCNQDKPLLKKLVSIIGPQTSTVEDLYK